MVATPLSPALPAPRRITKAQVLRWIRSQCAVSDTSGNVCYADNAPGRVAQFDPEQHKAYNAQVYFKGAPSPARPGSRAYQRWAMSDAPRGAKAQKAYDDFLRGLEVAGVQEHLDEAAVCPASMPDAERREILSEVLGASASGVPDSNAALKDLAQWERYMTLRRDAPLRRKWYEDLRKRCTRGLDDAHEAGAAPPIRQATVKLLVRPAEEDFQLVKFLLNTFTIFTLLASFASQIGNTVNICAGPYLCPVQAGWPHRPVFAPPAHLRLAKSARFKQTSFEDYYTKLEPSCEFGASGCTQPGYLIEWPYLQTTDGTGALVFPENLKPSCTRIATGNEKFVYDPIASRLESEYWKCEGATIPFMEGETAFHFTNAWYEKAHTVTVKCMEAIEPDLSSWQNSTVNGALLGSLELCFLNDAGWKGFQACACNPTQATWSLADNTAENINEHALFGCFVSSPAATAIQQLEYEPCSAVPYRSIFRATNSEAQARELAESRSGAGVSRKTALVIFFLMKELAVLGSVVVAIILGFVFACVAPIFIILVQIASVTLAEAARPHFKAMVWNMCEDLFAEVSSLGWSMCTGISNSFRSWEMLRRVLFQRQFNAVLVKDGINKITALANITFNLTVLVFSGVTYAEDESFAWITIILSTLNATFQILLEKERQKFLTSLMKDMNENRLTKFEFALGITKMLEDFLEDDVQYNFVQHLYDDERVRPRILDEFETAEARQPGQFKKRWSKPDDELEAEMNNGAVRDIVCFGPIQNPNNPTIFPYYPILPQSLAAKFGHDDNFEYASAPNTTNTNLIVGSSSLSFAKGTTSDFHISSPQPMQMSILPPVMNNTILMPPWVV